MFIKASLYGVLTLLSTTSAFALTCDTGSSSTCAASATAASDCEDLGFSKDSPNGCKHYLYCPFDTSYKRCVSLDCTSYTLSSCPANGYCESCKTGGHNYYTLDGCNTGYVKSGNSCVVRTCPRGYSTAYSSVSRCGFTGSSGWSFSSDGYSGDKLCGKCDEIPCPSGYSTTYSSVSSCGSTGVSGWDLAIDGYSGNKRCRKCIAKPCPGYPLTSCPEGATRCRSCWSGDTLKYKVNGCKRGYIASNNTCVADPCTGFPHSSCPEGATMCRSCLSGSSTKYKVNDCKRGYIASNNTCVAKTCDSYGYSSYPSEGTVCRYTHRVQLGASAGTCYSGCKSCSSLGRNYNATTFCKNNPRACYTTSTGSVSGYVGSCKMYYRTSCTNSSAARCTSGGSTITPGN